MADKTLGDYGVEVEAAVANGNCGGVPAIVAEMRASLPPKDPNAPAPEPPKPVNQGKEVYADKLDHSAQINNVYEARQLAEEMKTVEPPTPPAPPADTGSAGSAGSSGTTSGTDTGISGGTATSA